MASTAKIDRVGEAITKATRVWNEEFYGINHAIAGSGRSEDTPDGTLSREEWREFLAATKSMGDALHAASMAAWRVREILEKASPGNPNCRDLRHSGACARRQV